MNTKTQTACAASGIGFVILYTVGWWFIAGFVPPHAPLMTGPEVAGVYAQGTGTIRFGVLLAMTGAALMLPFSAVIAVQIRRIEGELPVLSLTELACGAVTTIMLLLPTVLWTAAAFRPERSPELIMLYNDLAWLVLLMTFAPFLIQFVCIALAVLSDKRAEPLFARWVGYFNIWVGVLAIPGGLITFFKTGPFAWNGLLAFWVPVAVFLLWFVVMFIALLKAIRTPAES
jgi:hypothetical protein